MMYQTNNGFNRAFILLLICFATVGGKPARKRVCIIGAGVSGLVNTKYFSDYPNEFEVVNFEKNSDVGGLWIYTDSTTVDDHGLPVHSSIYNHLWTNSVKDEMIFPDYPYFGDKSTDGRFVNRKTVLQYLRNYTNHFNLRKFIKLHTNVEEIKPLTDLKWSISSRNLNNNKTSETICDNVIVCNGHNFKGHIPKITGIENFNGQVLHSHVYRKPEKFTDQTVVILGASFSGLSIGDDISSTATKVYLSHRHEKRKGKFPENIEQVPGVIGAESDKLILSNGTKIRADALVLCTGYEYEFNFLDNSTGIDVVAGKYIRSIYKAMINVDRPTMAFMDIPNRACHFNLVHNQAYYLLQVFRGKLKLPTSEKMRLEAEKELAKLPPNESHVPTWEEYFKYYDEIAHESGGNPLAWWVRPYMKKLQDLMNVEPLRFQEKRFIKHENNRTVEFV